MANLSGIVKQLKKERDRVRNQLLGLETALTAFASAYRGVREYEISLRRLKAKCSKVPTESKMTISKSQFHLSKSYVAPPLGFEFFL
jgi:hypothetical protein